MASGFDVSDYPIVSAGDFQNPYDWKPLGDNSAYNSWNADINNQVNSFNAENAFNAWAFGKSMQYNDYQVRQQRAYESYMSGTAFQRAAADLKAAGFNPALALGSSASTPSSSAASVGTSSSSRMNTPSAMNAYQWSKAFQWQKASDILKMFTSAFALMMM